MEYILITFALIFISLSQVLQKVAAVKSSTSKQTQHFIIRLAQQRETWWALLSLAIGTLLWLVVLSKMEVSKAFPFLSLGSVIVLLASHYYLKESVSRTRWTGVIIIMFGIMLLAQS